MSAEQIALGSAFGGQAIGSITSGVSESFAQKGVSAVEQATARTNAQLAELHAREAIDKGEREAVRLGKAARQLIGTQRASFANQGVVVGAGSAGEVEASTRQQAQEDLERIRNNAWREAWGFRFQADQERFKGDVSKITRDNIARSSLLTAGIQGLSSLTAGTYYLSGTIEGKQDKKLTSFGLDSNKSSPTFGVDLDLTLPKTGF